MGILIKILQNHPNHANYRVKYFGLTNDTLLLKLEDHNGKIELHDIDAVVVKNKFYWYMIKHKKRGRWVTFHDNVPEVEDYFLERLNKL